MITSIDFYHFNFDQVCLDSLSFAVVTRVVTGRIMTAAKETS